MRCITAIWPVGPPKLSSATRSHTRKASWSDTPCAASSGEALRAESSAKQMPPSPSLPHRGESRLPRARTAIEVLEIVGEPASGHAQPPRQASVAQSLDAAASDGEPAFPRAGKISKRVIGRKTRTDSGLKIGSRPRVLSLVPPRYHRPERFR